VRFVPHNGVEDKSGNPYVYYPLAKSPWGGTNIFVRSVRPVAAALPHGVYPGTGITPGSVAGWL